MSIYTAQSGDSRGIMQKPAYKVKIGSETFDSTTSSEILGIAIDCDMNIPLDIFSIVIKPGDKAAAIKKGDEVSIELGYEGALSKVFTGTVDAVEPKVSGTAVKGYSAAAAFAWLKIHQIYDKQTSGAIVKDLAQRAKIKVKEAEDGISFPMFVADDSKSAYEHMKEIAGLNGFDLYMTTDGQVVFKKYASKTPKPFKYGRDILRSTVQELTPSTTNVKVFEESPASFKGADKSHWLSKKVMGGSSGSGDNVLLIRHPAIRDKDTADKVAMAKLESLLVSLKGTIQTLGNPKVALGDTIAIKEMPDKRMEGEFEVTKVGHAFNVEQGYVTTFGWIKKVSISPGEPPMVEPPSVPAPPKEPSFLEEQLAKAQEAMEESRLKLIDSIESAEGELEGMLEEVNKALAEVDKLAQEAINAAGEVKKAAESAANEALKYVDELKKELEAKKKELNKAIDDAEKKYEEAKAKAEEPIKKAEEEINKLKEKAESLKKEAEDRVKELKDKAGAELKKLEDEADGLKSKAKEWADKAASYGTDANVQGISAADKSGLEAKKKEAEEKAKGLEKELEDKKKALEDKKAELEKKAEDIKKEVEDKVKEAWDKVKEAEDKVKEEKKKVEDTLKEAEDKVKEARKKLDDTVKELQDKIDEASAEPKKILKEANDKYNEAVKKAEESKKEAAKAVESLKKAYKEARDTVMSARKMAGMD